VNVERPLRLTGIDPERAYTPNAIKALKETAERADAFCGIAGRPVETDRGYPMNPGAAPVRFTQATRAADKPGDGASENNPREEPDDSVPRRPVPLLSPLSTD